MAEPDNAGMHYSLGFALISQGKLTIDSAERKALRIRARNAFIRSKELGKRDALVDALIGGMDPNGSDGADFSKNVLANALMVQAEGYYGSGKLEEALANYLKALELDPKIYEAALFSGDVFMHREKFADAVLAEERASARLTGNAGRR